MIDDTPECPDSDCPKCLGEGYYLQTHPKPGPAGIGIQRRRCEVCIGTTEDICEIATTEEEEDGRLNEEFFSE